MNLRTRILSGLIVLALLAGLIYIAIAFNTSEEDNSPEPLFSTKTTLNLWYNDDALTDYLNEMAVQYNESQNDYRVVPQLQDGVDYLDSINKTSIAGTDYPDMYVISNDQLAKASLAGLATEVTDRQSFADNVIFPQTAINAVTFDGQVIAYPFYFETAALLYNSTYLKSMADSLGQSLSDTVPVTVQDIIKLANNYNAPEGVTDIFTWDVSDIFYNYYFLGSFIDVGGAAGDDPKTIDIYNADAIQALAVYQQLGQYFSPDTKTKYETILDNFCSGKVVFTTATTDAVEKIKQAADKGTFTGDYGVTKVPDITDSLKTKGLSVTQCIAVNGYSEQQDACNSFIRYMIFDHNTDFYDRTGKGIAQNGYKYSDSHMTDFFNAYADSTPMPKMRQTGNFWMFMENTFAQVWDGADPNDSLKSLYEQTMVQITGNNDFTCEKLADPAKIDLNEGLTNDGSGD
ncbi:MAG: extracellular solute-binding protein [Lachnospiraceae bacterium]|jgi:arabinogalactan oligomer/maltooligosaccharide transport system substrate-binding protein|nr:extracellular solute-binding protein [Lachnospiraceae bacterium]